jgi:NAD(P)H dehydrogenase (quinone)
MSSSPTRTLLVTGGSGHLSRRVIELLLETNAGHIITTTRTPEKLADLAARGIEVRQADFDSPESLASAFAGADRLLLVSTDMVDGTDRRAVQHRNAVSAAAKAGVRHVVYTSLTNPGPDSPITLAPDHHATEQALAASSLDWTILRNNVYTDSLLQGLPHALATGQLVKATGDGTIGYVTREDCARAAAAALASAESGRVIYDITGPALVSQAEIAQIASQITGRPVAYVPVPAEALRAGMVGAGLPGLIADLLVSFDLGAAQGTLSVASSAVADLTGQAPQSVAEFLHANSAALLA